MINNWAVTRLERFGAWVTDQLAGIGRFTLFSLMVMKWLVLDAVKPRRWKLLLPQMYDVGTRSVPVVAVVGLFIGAVMAVEMFHQMKVLGQEGRIGAIINMSVVKQIGPVLAAVMLAGRVGGAFTAEIGTMRVTEQVDALRVMATDPRGYLAAPRVLACVLMIPVLVCMSDVLGIFGGLIISKSLGVVEQEYWKYSAEYVRVWDFSTGVFKSMVFGLAISLISCYKGFNCERGAQGVGRATTDAFVTSFICIMILNFVLAKLAQSLDLFVNGSDSATLFG